MSEMVQEHRNTFARAEDHARGDADELRHARYGGFHFGPAFFGWLVATSAGVLLLSLLSALGLGIALTKINNASQAVSNADTVGLISGIVLVAALALAYYAGGYVAGRMARFDGARQGLGVWIVGLVIAIVLGMLGAILGARYNLLQQISLPSLPVNGASFTRGGLLAALATLIATALAAIAGGKAGERYHSKVDAVGTASN
jgi:hypothetical protein